jgi:hypothetical protein
MDVDKILCLLCKSSLSDIFNEEQSRMLLPQTRRETKRNKEILFNDINDDRRHLTLVLSGEVLVIRTLDDVEIMRGKCSVGCYFGALKALRYPNGVVPPNEMETVVKEGGTGVNNCVITAAANCDVLRIPIANIREVLAVATEVEGADECDRYTAFSAKLLETLAGNVENLEKLNALVFENQMHHEGVNLNDESHVNLNEEYLLRPVQRTYHQGLPELERQQIQKCLQNIQTLWRHVTRGANTVPRGSVNLIKEFLGESGIACYDSVFAPMDEQTAPSFFDEETFWSDSLSVCLSVCRLPVCLLFSLVFPRLTACPCVSLSDSLPVYLLLCLRACLPACLCAVSPIRVL